MNAPTIPEPHRSVATGVLGAGRLGSALVAALASAGVRKVEVASRRPGQARAVAAALGIEAVSPAVLVARCDLVFLTVPDAAIRLTARDLPWRDGQAVVHCSGALGLEALVDAAARGADTGCLHPLQTFPPGAPVAQAPTLFNGIVCGLESNTTSLSALLEAITMGLGARPIQLQGVDRALYHAAAVMVSNDVVSLMAAETARQALAPLLLAAAENIGRLPLEQALTGPIARGDVATVEGHLRALGGDPDLRELYRRLALELVSLDLGHSPVLVAELKDALG
jgi:predicted short-subunit dehydrogenase-like oxidoreductase (DUF2520 family)